MPTDQPGVRYNLLGNTALKPEKSTEFEAGFETKLANNRVSLDLTFYHKKTEDALISAMANAKNPTCRHADIAAVQTPPNCSPPERPCAGTSAPR